MNIKTTVAAAALFLALPIAAGAQGVVRGADEGAHEGEHAAGPVGAVVGGVVGAVSGGVAGLLGVDQRPRFREYVIREHRDSYSYDHAVAVGAILPDGGVTYYDVPSEFGVRGYRYAVVNNRTVLVDPSSHRIVDVIE
ncbi:MAG: DUF1236 domain-containing protein [Beijerinckiaceae bacterium]